MKRLPDGNEMKRLQWQQVLNAFNSQRTLAVQVMGFLIAVDSVLTGYSLTLRLGGMLALGGAIPIFAIVSLWLARSQAVPNIYLGMRLERELGMKQTAVMTTYIRLQSPHRWKLLDAALRLDDADEQLMAVRRVMLNPRFLWRNPIALMLILTSILQFSLAILAIAFFEYKVL